MALFGKKSTDDKKADKPAKVKAAPAPGPGMIMPGSGDKSESTKKTKAKKLRDNTTLAYRVLVKPLISEKGTFLNEENTYLFQVSKSANKFQIKQAIKSVYGVDPLKVRVMNISGKSRRSQRSTGKTSDWKKAMVTLPADQKLDLHEGV